MRSRWWSWISAVLAVLCGLAFGWVAGSGLVRAASLAAAVVAPPVAASPAASPGAGRDRLQPRWAANQACMRRQPSSASSLR